MPSQEYLKELLTRHSVPDDAMALVQQAASAVEKAVGAALQARWARAEDLESLWSQADNLTDLLAEYARIMTRTVRGLQRRDQQHHSQ